MRFTYSSIGRLALTLAVLNVAATSAVLIQHNNYMLDDSEMIGNQDNGGGSFAPFSFDQGVEHTADSDIIKSLSALGGRSLFAKMLMQDPDQQDQAGADQGNGQLNHDLAELLAATQSNQQQQSDSAEQKQAASDQASGDSGSISAADAAGLIQSDQSTGAELDTSSSSASISNVAPHHSSSGAAAGSAVSHPNKMELKTSGHWFNPKEIIPVLKISSMATPSKYKKVYFRSEKKLVDGAFHAPSAESEKKSMLKQFNSGVQRRSSKASAAGGSPPSVFQDGVLDFLRKFRDVYIQTRPVSPPKTNLASSVMSAAASSPIVSMLLPPSSSSSSSGNKPNFANALSAASSMINSAAMLAQASNAAATSAASSSSSGSSNAAQASLASGSSSGATGAVAAAGAGSANGSKRPVVTGQTYVQFWSKTFPDWVRKMLKQLRRRSLHNSSKRQQQQHHHHHHSASLGQATQASGSSANTMVERASSGSSSQSSSSS